MDVGTTLSVVQTLLAALQCTELKEILSIFGYKSQLDELHRTVSTINAAFLDAETKQELTHEARHWIEELKDAVFEADDLFDEFVTLAEQKQLVEAGGSLSNKVTHFFSRTHNPLSVKGVKDIKKKLDAIATNSQLFSFKIDSEPILKRRPETCSYVDANEIFGRKGDLDSIVRVLLHSDVVPRKVSFLTIVGIGGLGKTALAQLVYNDPRVTASFPLRLWSCVSDQDQKELDVKEVLGKILASVTGDNNHEGSTMDQVQRKLRDKLAGKKYLLVLDDVWTERSEQWHNLVKYLGGGQIESWIVVTTRSHKTSSVVGDGHVHELQGLSEEYSWRLFERTAFGSDQSNPPSDLVEIGRDIVNGCARVPLAIRVVGSLLYGQDKIKWRELQEIGLANIRDGENGIIPILKLSYHNLESPLRSCFSYCALFPKDYRIEKKKLISLWVAQGFIIPFDKGQSIESAGDEYFSTLLRRCFFQDIVKDNLGEITSCKIHDLMHDIAQSVSGKEIYTVNGLSSNIYDKARHLAIDVEEYGKFSLGKTYIRSYVEFDCAHSEEFCPEPLVANCRYLRALDVSESHIKSLPASIGKLLHLRYLNLSHNEYLEVLPKSIEKLYNLQTLKLRYCSRLKELPKSLSKLVKLRALDIHGCSKVTCMPRGMRDLTCLYTLSDFIADVKEDCLSIVLEDLKALNNLKGYLKITIRWPQNDINPFKEERRTEGLYLRNKEHLHKIMFSFRHEDVGERVDNNEEARRLIEELQPHPNVKFLSVDGYHGAKIPRWATLLPNLVELHLSHCRNLRYLPCFGKLHYLKIIRFYVLPEVEYINEDSHSANSSLMPMPRLVSGEVLSYFPSLVELSLACIPKLKGWRGMVARTGDDHAHQPFKDSSTSSSKAQLQSQPCLSHLKLLTIHHCPELIWIPPCPKVESLDLRGFNKRLRIINIERDMNSGEIAPASLFSSCNDIYDPSTFFSPQSSGPENFIIPIPTLKFVKIDNVAWLKTLPMEAFQCLHQLEIQYDNEVESLGEVKKVLLSCSRSLRKLEFYLCKKIESVVSEGLEHLPAEEELVLHCCPNLRLSEDGENDGGNKWPALLPSLRALHLNDLTQLVNLPRWMQFLLALQSLRIDSCKGLNSMPNWIPKLASLRELNVRWCSTCLERRCRKDPPGEDWPYIQHIPHTVFESADFMFSILHAVL